MAKKKTAAATISTSDSKKKNGCVLKRCDCEHSYQDWKFGSQVRVHNRGIKADKCTVCSKQKTHSIS